MKINIRIVEKKSVPMASRSGHAVIAGSDSNVWALFPGDESQDEADHYVAWKLAQRDLSGVNLRVVEYCEDES